MAQQSTHGGARPGAGRPKGAKNKYSKALLKKLEAQGVDPAEYLIDIMQRAVDAGDDKLALRAAESLMPYVHPRLSTVDMSVKGQLAPVSIRVRPYASGSD